MRLGKVRHESKYLAIEYFHTEKNWSIGWMCKHLEVARAAYYKWLHRETPEDEMENIKLAELIKEYDERFSRKFSRLKRSNSSTSSSVLR